MRYQITFNLPANDGSTIAHYLCQYGQLSFTNQLLSEIPETKMKYFLDFNMLNRAGDQPVLLCKRYNMNNMFSSLTTNAKKYGIEMNDNDVEREEQRRREILLANKSPPKPSVAPKEEKRRWCVVM